MTDEELDKLISGLENDHVEFKADLWATDDQMAKLHVMRTVSAFLNTRGGILLLGVRDNSGDIIGLNNAQKTEHAFLQQLNSNLDTRVSQLIQMKVHDYRGTEKKILIINCPKGPRPPYTIKSIDRPFIRVGSANQLATDEQVSQMHRDRSIDPLDRGPIRSATIDDVDLDAAKKYIQETSSRDVSFDEVQPILIREGLLVSLEGVIVPTIAGLLLLGKKPQEHLPHATIRADVKLTEEQDGWDDTQEITGTIQEQIRSAESFVRRNIPVSAKIVGFRRIESPVIPIEALREAIINALVHRDYQDSSAEIHLRIRGSGVSVLNPGGLLPPLTIEVVLRGNFEPRSRNGTVAAALIRLKYMEKRGTGIAQIRKLLQETKLAEPEFTDEGNTFRVVIKAPVKTKTSISKPKAFISESELERLALNESHYRVLDLLQEQGEVRSSEIEDLLGKTRPTVNKILDELVEKEVLIRTTEKKQDPKAAYRLNPKYYTDRSVRNAETQGELGL